MAEGRPSELAPATRGRTRPQTARGSHALREAESELEARAEELAPILGSTPEVKLLLDEEAEGVDGVAATILEEAAGADVPSLISVGRRGLGAVQRARVGSVSTKVVRATRGLSWYIPTPAPDRRRQTGLTKGGRPRRIAPCSDATQN